MSKAKATHKCLICDSEKVCLILDSFKDNAINPPLTPATGRDTYVLEGSGKKGIAVVSITECAEYRRRRWVVG